tara:strand:- start:1192 stop:3099 length:1908 start_codon:yes stop_codon:yes gene_type:complete
MKIAYKHLLELLTDKPNIDDLSDILFQLGHEHEIENSIFNMEFTPNRGDCLSLLGLARDLNYFYRKEDNIKIYDGQIDNLNLSFVNHAQADCPDISFLNIEIEGSISNYKDYLGNYFKDLNINKNNFFTDVSNYIAYEIGQPTHVYDFNSIDGEVTLERDNGEQIFNTLLKKSIQLKDENLVFKNKNEVINLAGIIGNFATSCQENSTNVLIECAYFRPESIIGKSIKYDIHSEASHKFERGVDPQCHEKVLRRFIQIVSDHAEIIKIGLSKHTSLSHENTLIDINLDKVNKILGTKITQEQHDDALNKLGFKISNKISVPSYRSDVSHQNDIAEEIARIIGYDNIFKNTLILPTINKKYAIDLSEERIKSFLIDNGFYEIISSPFNQTRNKNSINVDNPLDSNRKYLRTNIVDSLIENIIYNEKRQKDSLKFFEISDVYSFDGSILKDKRLAVIISGRRGHNPEGFSKKLDKEYLSSLFSSMNINIEKDIVTINRDKLDSKIKNPIFAIELSIKKIKKFFINYKAISKSIDHFVEYNPISEYPSTYRDLSFSVEDSSKIEDLKEQLNDLNVQYLKTSFMFDYYKNLNTNIIKIGYRFIFQSFDKTLKDTEVDKSINKIIDKAISIESVTLPGIS